MIVWLYRCSVLSLSREREILFVKIEFSSADRQHSAIVLWYDSHVATAREGGNGSRVSRKKNTSDESTGKNEPLKSCKAERASSIELSTDSLRIF